MKKNFLLMVGYFVLFCLNSVAQADAISYSKNFYSASVGAGGISDSDPGPNPPVSATVNYSDPDPNSAHVEALGNTSLLKVAGSISGGSIGAHAASHHEREFLAKFSEIYFVYDYYLYAEKSPSIGPGVAGGSVDTLVELFDVTANSSTWLQKLTKDSAIHFPEDELPVAGTVDEMLSLIEDHVYLLKINVSLNFGIAGENRSVGGSASISNLSVSAVPLPPTLGLLAWGLLLLGAHCRLRRRIDRK